MSVKIHGQVPPSHLPISDLPEGKLATIVKWGEMPHYVGNIVQRWGSHLVVIGATSGGSWPNWFTDPPTPFGNCLCEILPTGTKLEINNDDVD